MKILMLTHRFPYPPVRGDSLRSWGEVEYLARRHDLWLACVDRTAPAAKDVAHVREICRDVAIAVQGGLRSLLRGGLSWLSGRSLTEGYFHNAGLARIIRRWDAGVNFDAVLTFSSAMAPYAGLVGARRRVLDMNDVESEKWRSYADRSKPPLSWLYRLESRRLPRAESRWAQAHDVSLLVNECERKKLPPELVERAAVVRTGVDLGRYLLEPGVEPYVRDEPVIGFVGSVSYAPNVRGVQWFGRKVWPQIHSAIPSARWLIVGNRPRASVRRWDNEPGVTVTGFVPDVRPWLRAMRVFVCPMREQIGVQTKLIEAMAAGRPAVVTPEAAVGIDHTDPPPFVIARSANEFSEACIRVLRDEAHARALANRARAVAEANYGVADQLGFLERWLTGEAASQPGGETRAPVPGLHGRYPQPTAEWEVVRS